MALIDRPATPATYFEEQWGRNDDPWDHGTRWYERRKYAITLAALPRERYRRSFEPGCGPGFLTRSLATRSHDHLAMERHPRGARSTTRRCSDQPTVTVVAGQIPNDWPTGSFDLVVLSEVLYYLDESALEETLNWVQSSLEPGGDLIAVHYRPPVDDHTWTGDEVHEKLLSRPAWEPTLQVVDPCFRLDVFRR